MPEDQSFFAIWRFIIEEDDQGARLDQFLSQQEDVPLSRSRIKKLIEDGFVTVDEAPSKPAHKLRENQNVVLRLPPQEPLEALPEEIPLDVYYEDEWLVVVNKPQGLVVHPAPGHSSGTLINGILFGRQTRGGDPLRPGIVHRLDKDTSGLIVVAKTEAAHASLAKQFHDHTIERRYQVLVSGSPPDSGEWRTLHGRHPRDRKRFSSKVIRGKVAVSHFVTRERFLGAARLEVTLLTGRTHQVRVHCCDHGFPVLGDPLYGPNKMNSVVRRAHDELIGQALHAERLAFDHPATSARLSFDAPVPRAFERALKQLRLDV